MVAQRDGRWAPGRRLRYAAALLALVFGLQAVFGQETTDVSPPSGGEVWVVDLEGPLGPATADLIIRSIDDAETAGARALVIRMDTPGGLDKAMRMLVKRILAAELPVVTFVSPDGARAASAGTYIAYASHIAAMAPATNIGSSTPVSLSPAPQMPRPAAPDRDPATSEEPEMPAPADAMTRKVVNDAVAYLQSLAELRGRNIEWAEETVRLGANLRASEALQKNVIDVIAADLPTLLAAIHGRTVKLPQGSVVLDVADARVHQVETDWQHELLEIITDPTIAYGLLIFGIYGLILEFYNPGMIFPSVIGIICLLLGAYGLQMLPINYAGLALIVVGIAMMIIEVFTPTLGILGFAGLAAFVFGSLILMDTEAPGYQVPLTVIAAFAVATAGLTLFAIGFAVRARRQKLASGRETLVGGRAEALEDFTERGQVWAVGERWTAEAPEPVRKGQRLTITAVNGITLTVVPSQQEEG